MMSANLTQNAAIDPDRGVNFGQWRCCQRGLPAIARVRAVVFVCTAVFAQRTALQRRCGLASIRAALTICTTPAVAVVAAVAGEAVGLFERPPARWDACA